jgi:hypothetical protein
MAILPLQSSPNHTSVVEGDGSRMHVVTHPIKPLVEELVILMQSLVNLTLLFEGDVSSNHVVSIPDLAPSEQERVLLSLSSLPPSLEEVHFDWDGLVGYPMPLPMSFPVRDIIRSITKMITSVSTLSSLAWRALDFPKLMSIIRKVLPFHRSPAWEPWPPP